MTSKRSRFLLACLTALFLFSFPAYSQEEGKKEDSFGIKFSGFVKVDYMLDTRQTIAAREGDFLLFPAAVKLGPDGQDLNAGANFNILAIQTRLTGKISGPEFFHMKTSGMIEGAFFGQSNDDINGFRLRHAFVKLEGKKVDLLFGQYWHPLFVVDCFPAVYSFNTGVPFQPFSRNPQFRISTKGTWRLIGVLYTQRDFASIGPEGTSPSYMRNAAIPGAHLQVQRHGKKLIYGAGLDSKTIRPSQYDAAGNRSEELLTSFAALGFIKAKQGPYTLKLEAVYGQNMADLLLLGGIAEADTLGTFTAFHTYAAWAELSREIGHMELGIFGAYSKNLGLLDELGGHYYAIGGDIDHLFRVSPRVVWKSGSTRIGLEMEYTSATYGKFEDQAENQDRKDPDRVANLRMLCFVYYGF